MSDMGLDELVERLDDPGLIVLDVRRADEGAEVVAYCHSGSRSAMAVQVLAAAGYDARNYVGSWHEWSRHAELPAEAGRLI